MRREVDLLEKAKKHWERQSYAQGQRTMRKQIEQLIAEFERSRIRAVDRRNECLAEADADSKMLAEVYLGKRLAYNGILARLRAILAPPDAVSDEKGTVSRD